MNLEVEGKITKILPEVSGEGKNGRWLKQSFVIETHDSFPKKICMQMWNDKAKILSTLAEGDEIVAGINIESREFNERWYTDITAWKIEKKGTVQPGAAMSTSYDNAGGADIPLPSAPAAMMESDEDDDLPF